MVIKSKQLFILIGDDKTGKTTLQKLLIEKIHGQVYDRLPTDILKDINHPEIKRKYRDISFSNRSYQEKIEENGTVDEYFIRCFKDADICFISSHLDIGHITEMIRNGKQRFYNVNAVFFSNSIALNKQVNSDISLLDWDERLVIENDELDNENEIKKQLERIADNITFFIVNRTNIS